MASEIGKKERSVSRNDNGVRRRGFLRVGTLLTALTGATAISSIGATSPLAEAKALLSPLPDLSATLGWAVSPLAYGAVGDGVADDTAALNAAISATAVGGTVELGGLTYATTAVVAIGKSLTLRNGGIKAGAHRAILVNAADVTLNRLDVSRLATTPTTTDTLADRSSVIVQGARFRSLDCSYINANHACIYIGHGQGNGSIIRGNRFANSSARQNACAVYAAAGASRNLDLRIEGNIVEHTGSPDGILVYDANACTISENTIRHLRALPELTFTGWSFVSGNVYRTPERRDGITRVILWNGTELTEETAAPTAPPVNSWGISGGNVYLNLSGTNPSTGTVLSRIVSGYALLFYSTTKATSGMCDNFVSRNIVEDVDGFGIYLQLDRADALRNGTDSNRLFNVCLKGEQSNKLPFAGIGVVGGNQTMLSGDAIHTIGMSSTPAPGFRVNPPKATGTCTGTVTGMTVSGATRSGILIPSGTWLYNACRSNGNAANGFETFRTSNGQIIDAVLSGCEADGNTLSGVNVDNTGFPGAVYRVSVIGGTFRGNNGRGVIIRGGKDCKVVGATLGVNGAGLAQIQVDGSAARVLVSDNVISSGTVGVAIDATVTDATVSNNAINSRLTSTPLSLATPVRTGGAGHKASEYSGTGTPEGTVTAAVGSRYFRLDGGAGTVFYVKESGTGNTGWVAK
jgi:hypothetical protein